MARFSVEPRGQFVLAQANTYFGGWPTLSGDPNALVMAFPVEGWRTSAAVVVRQDSAKLFHRKPDGKRATNKPDTCKRFGRIKTIARSRPLWARQQPPPLVMTERVGTDAGSANKLTGAKRSVV